MAKEKIKNDGQGSGSKAESELYSLATFVPDVLMQCFVIVGREKPKMEKEKTKDEGQGSGSKAESKLYSLSYLALAFVLR